MQIRPIVFRFRPKADGQFSRREWSRNTFLRESSARGHLARISHAAAGLRPLYDGPLGGVAGSSQTRPASGHVRFLPALQPGRGSERAVRRLRQPGLGPDAEQEEGVGHGVVGPGAAGAVLEVCADVDGLAVETLPGKQGPGLFQA